jgi:predicted molibdopterin-dependent oxidoreductase YjgC
MAKCGTVGVLAEVATPLTDRAGILLPSAVPMMKSGTMVNVQGRVQKLRRAMRLDPAGVVYPHWRIVKRIAATAGHPVDFADEAGIFEEIARSIPLFAGLTWDAIGDFGLPFGGAPDVDPEDALRHVDRCAPEWRSENISSRMPWEH